MWPCANLITVTPKNPDKLREQVETQQGEPAESGHERTAEGLETPTPTRGAFLGNLKKVARRVKKD
jgi:hypothetical protein